MTPTVPLRRALPGDMVSAAHYNTLVDRLGRLEEIIFAERVRPVPSTSESLGLDEVIVTGYAADYSYYKARKFDQNHQPTGPELIVHPSLADSIYTGYPPGPPWDVRLYTPFYSPNARMRVIYGSFSVQHLGDRHRTGYWTFATLSQPGAFVTVQDIQIGYMTCLHPSGAVIDVAYQTRPPNTDPRSCLPTILVGEIIPAIPGWFVPQLTRTAAWVFPTILIGACTEP